MNKKSNKKESKGKTSFNADDEYQKQNSYYARNMIFTLIIIIAIWTWRSYRNGPSMDFNWTETNLTVICPDDDETKYSMNYDDIISLELVTVSDFGTCIWGDETKTTRYGTWKNDEWGTYNLCCDTDFDDCIVIKSENVTLVMNYESEDVTASILETIQGYCNLED